MRLFVRWLRHRSRIPRKLRGSAAVILAALCVSGLAAQSGGAATPSAGSTLPPSQNGSFKLPFAPGPGDPIKTFPDSPQLIADGRSLYQQSCSTCHGMNLRGVPGRAPSLIGVGAGPVDFYLRTGRMPLANPYQEPERARPAFNRGQINALVDFVSSFGGPPAPTADPSKGNIETGLDQFTLHCAGCHQMVGRGGMFIGAWVPNLQNATAQDVAEAVRMGPYLMPNFDVKQIDQFQVDSLAKYVLYTQHPDNAGGWSIYNLGPIPEGIVAWLLGLAALVIVARLIGERNDEGAVKNPIVPK